MRKIKWEKWKNPITDVDIEGEEVENTKLLIRETPFGLQPSKINLDTIIKNRIYLGHTDFDIDEKTILIINDIDGVESVEVATPYMFRLVIGKAFNGKKVRRKITEVLCGNEDVLFNVEDDTEIYKETIRLRQQKKPWAIYVLPNGKYESFTANNEEELEKILIGFSIVRSRIGGTILSS